MKMILHYLRLMRFPLVFTAIGDAWAVRMLGQDAAGSWSLPPAGDLALLGGVSFGLYGLGMVLNDVVDAKADAESSPDRPIPSGAVPRAVGAVLALLLAGLAMALAAVRGSETLVVAGVAGLLIVGYDVGLKRWPVVGLLLLGLIRAVHCQISGVGLDGGQASPGLELAGWVSVFLFTHVALVSWIAYTWEGKRPRIGTVSRWLLAFTIVIIDVAAIGYLRSAEGLGEKPPAVVLPLLAGLAYLLTVVWVLGSRRFDSPRLRGVMAMRLGLMWLPVYGASILASDGRWAAVIVMAVLLALTFLTSRGLIFLGMRAGLQEPTALARSTMKSDTPEQ